MGVGGDVGQVAKPAFALREVGQRALLLGDVLSEEDDTADAALGVMPGPYFPALPLDGAIGAQERVGVTALAGAGKAALNDVATALRPLRQQVVDAAPDEVLIAEAVAVAVGAAGREIAHLAVEHGQANRGGVDATPQNIFTRIEAGGFAPALRCAQPVRLHPTAPESGRRRCGYCHRPPRRGRGGHAPHDRP